MSRAVWLSALAGAGVTAMVAAGVVLAQPPAVDDVPDAPRTATASVTRGDLVEEVRVRGAFGHGERRALGTTLQGTVTGLPEVGAVLGQGDTLVRVDDAPVVLLRGTLPAWRDLGRGMTPGRDVLQLEKALVTLGHLDVKADTTFDARTQVAVKAFQKEHGLRTTGVLEHGRVVFVPADVRVGAVDGVVGGAAGAELVTVTGTTVEVRVDVDAQQASLAPVGAPVTVLLPDGRPATATVAAAGAPVVQEGAGPRTPLVVALDDEALDDEAAAAISEGAGVDVLLARTRATDAVLVPVDALLAQPGGGFAVEVVATDAATTDGSPATRLVPVELGQVASGRAQLTSGDVTAGDTVVVAR